MNILLLMMVSTIHTIVADNALTYSPEESFLKANAYYRSHHYEKALEQYKTITRPSAGVLYNIGNSYYALHNYPQALAYWFRAQRLASMQLLQKINKNIDHLMQDQHKEHYHSFARQLGMYAHALFPILFLQLLTLSVLLLLVFLIYRRKYYIKTILLLLFIGVSSSALVTCSYMVHSCTYGVVTANTVPVYAGPNQGYAQVGSLSELDRVTIGKHEDTWYKISHAQITGWVSSDALEIV